VQGREERAAQRLRAEARAVTDAGADLLVLECVPSALAAEISRDIAIPTIGIGAGPDCDGQILVLHDMLGIASGHRRPRFVKNFLEGLDSIEGAGARLRRSGARGSFPSAEHGYQ
jgi:3-methyl-2-oxobutanoate hydroxymethyltransferase